MQKWILFLLIVCLLLPCVLVSADTSRTGWTVTVLTGEPIENSIKNKKEFKAEVQSLYQAHKKRLRGRKSELTSGSITIDGWQMEIAVQQIGKPGKNGYPVYINLHGGGTGDLDIQKEQFAIMRDYPPEGLTSALYIVPRGIIAGGEEHYWPESFKFYDRIIEDAIVFHNADPDRIYLMGFSSGGDGVYAVTPLMSDRFAAAEMSAGYPSHFMFENLYNTPFRVRMGELDSAYSRNTTAAKVDGILNSLSARYGGYKYQTLLYVGNGHNDWNETSNGRSRVYTGKNVEKWLNGQQASVSTVSSRSVDWLKQYTRDPLPKRVVWNTDAYASLRKTRGLYWLDRDGLLDNVTVVASYNKGNNTITVEECDAEQGTLKILLNPDMLDVFRPVCVKVGGSQVTVTPIVSRRIMEATLAVRGDPEMIFTSEIDITFNKKAGQITVQAMGSYKADYSVYDKESLLYWDDEGVFHVDDRLFGLTPSELSSLLGIDLSKPEPWPYWGDNLYWTSWGYPGGRGVIFMFNNNQSVLIYSETEGAVTEKLRQAVRDEYFNVWHILTNGGMSYYYLEDNPYDGKGHTVQQYQWIRYWFYRDMQQGLS